MTSPSNEDPPKALSIAESDVAAAEVLGEQPRVIDPEVERRVLRKIDLFLMPAMVIGKHIPHESVEHGTSNARRRVRPRVLRQGLTPSSPIKLPIARLTPFQAILGSAALFGMVPDLGLAVVDNSVTPPRTDTSRLSWATSIFYFGQLIGSYPMTYALQHFNSRYILGPVVMLWAIICAATAGVSDWRGLLAQRFFLGLFLLGHFIRPVARG